jgi:hypothetical protein
VFGHNEYEGIEFPDPAEDPNGFRWLVVGYADLGAEDPAPIPVIVAADAEVVGTVLGDLAEEPEDYHVAYPIFRVDYAGRA